MKNTVRKQLYIIFFIVTIIPLILVGGYLFKNMNNILIENKQKDIKMQMIDLSNAFSDVLIDVLDSSETLLSNEDLEKFVSKQYQDYYAVYQAYQYFQLFENVIAQDRNIANIRYVIDNPTLLTNSNIINVNSELLESEWLKKSKIEKDSYFWQELTDPITKVQHLSLIRGHFVNNKWLGTLVIELEDNFLRKMLFNKQETAILILDGTPLYSYFNEDYFVEDELINVYDAINQQPAETEVTIRHESYYVINQNLELKDTWTTNFSLLTLSSQRLINNEIEPILSRAVLFILGIVSVSVMLLLTFLRSFNWRVQQLKTAMFKVAHGDFELTDNIGGKDEIAEVYADLKQTVISVEKLMAENVQHEKKSNELELLQKESELKRLSSQLNPHFLYNTLEMIRMKALKNKDREVADIIKLLSKLMRQAYQKEEMLTSLAKEIEFVELYLKIQQLRFGERVTYDIYNDHVDLDKYHILPMVLQPLVENAFVHGIEMDPNSGHIQINIFEKETLEIEIIDDGLGIDSQKLKKIQQQLTEESSNRIGLLNSQKRIGLFYGKEFGIEIKSILGVGTGIFIKLPKIEGEGDNDESYSSR